MISIRFSFFSGSKFYYEIITISGEVVRISRSKGERSSDILMTRVKERESSPSEQNYSCSELINKHFCDIII